MRFLTGIILLGQASACSPGQYFQFTFKGTQCFPCEPGKWSDGSESTCTECAMGKYSEVAGGQASDCKNCPSGFASLEASAFCAALCPAGQFINYMFIGFSCWPCAPGTWSDGSTETCTSCASGKYLDVQGAQASDCKDCPSGFTSISASTICVPDSCPGGQFKIPTDTLFVCGPCLPGEWSDGSGQTCTDCASGKYLEVAGAQASECKDCPSGFKSSPGSPFCIFDSCPAGKYSLPLFPSVCVDCQPGRWSAGQTCTDCTAGKYLQTVGSSGEDCKNCPSGFSSQPASTACTRVACEGGQYKYSFLADTFVCLQCLPGQWSDGYTSECTKCSAGKYLEIWGSQASECKTCLDGSASQAGSLFCSACSSGKVSNSERISCESPSVSLCNSLEKEFCEGEGCLSSCAECQNKSSSPPKGSCGYVEKEGKDEGTQAWIPILVVLLLLIFLGFLCFRWQTGSFLPKKNKHTYIQTSGV